MGEGLEEMPVICVPQSAGDILLRWLSAVSSEAPDDGVAVLHSLYYMNDPELRSVVVPPGAQAGQTLRFSMPVWSPLPGDNNN